jgi:hypothetical protein
VDISLDASADVVPISPPPLRRPRPVIPSAIAQGATSPRTARSRQMAAAASGSGHIHRHPAYSPEMCEVHGDIPVPVKIEVEERGDEHNSPFFLQSPPKRPISVGSNEELVLKRKKTENGMQRVALEKSQNSIPKPLAHKDPMERPLSREEMRYLEVAKEHEEDARFLDNEAKVLDDHDHDHIPATPILIDNDMPLPRRPLRRSMSRSDIAVVEDLTPAIRELMSPAPRESSPDRGRWGALSPIPQPQESIQVRHNVPSHIRPIGSVSRAQVQFLPPGANALGAKSPELFIEEHPLGKDLPPPRLEHTPPADSYDMKPVIQRQMLPIPTSASDMPGVMTIHDRLNNTRHVEGRDFYIHKRTVAIAKGSEWANPCRDGTIRLGRYFSLTQEEVEETKEYLRFMAGHETTRPKTMIRLTCRPRNGEPSGQNSHAWPENTMVFLNGKSLLTTMVFNI